MSLNHIDASQGYVVPKNPDGSSCVVLVCEHASNHIPASFDALGLSPEQRQSHAAWDPGAMGVASRLADRLDAALIASGVSRLVFDCNRPPSAPDAMPARSEVVDVPGNAGLTEAQRAARAADFYHPFHSALRAQIARVADPILITIHSFTPVYHGAQRAVEIGILHDSDTRLADAMLRTAGAHTQANVQRNAPYGPEHGVTHTLKEHAIGQGHLNVMLEMRNDLIETAAQQDAMADMLASWIAAACAHVGAAGGVQCRA